MSDALIATFIIGFCSGIFVMGVIWLLEDDRRQVTSVDEHADEAIRLVDERAHFADDVRKTIEALP